MHPDHAEGLREPVHGAGPGTTPHAREGGPVEIFGGIADAVGDAAGWVGGAVEDAGEFALDTATDVAPVAGTIAGTAVGGPAGASLGGTIGSAVPDFEPGGDAEQRQLSETQQQILRPTVEGAQQSVERAQGSVAGAEAGARAGAETTAAAQDGGLLDSPIAVAALAFVAGLILMQFL